MSKGFRYEESPSTRFVIYSSFDGAWTTQINLKRYPIFSFETEVGTPFTT